MVHRHLACLAMMLSAAPGWPQAQTRIVTGQVGVLGEWELTATVEEAGERTERHWFGPLSLRHIGFCGADGPETRSGELRLQVSQRQAVATLTIDGTACTFRGQLKSGYAGVMRCADRRDVPMLLSFD